MARFVLFFCLFASVEQGAAVPDHALRRVASAVKQHRPHPEALRAVLRQASHPVGVAASHAVRRAATTPADDARLDLSRRFRTAKSDAAVQSLLRTASSKNDTSRMVLEPTISEAQDALQMLEAVRATLEEVSGLRQISADPVKSRANLAAEIADMEALVNGTDGSKWEPLLAPTIKAARQAYEDLGVPGEAGATNATAGADVASSDSTATTPAVPTEPPAMPYAMDEVLDEDYPWDDGYMTQYENQTSGDAAGSLPPPPGSAAAVEAAGTDSSRAGAGAVALGHNSTSAEIAGLDGNNGTSVIATSQQPLMPVGRGVKASTRKSSWMHA